MPDLPRRCQLGDCENRAALTVTIELPIEWSASQVYNAVTPQVAVCGDCAQVLEEHGRLLIAARVQYSRLREKADEGARMRTQLVALVAEVGPPYEPVQGSVFGRWLAGLDRNSAQAAWRLLADVKRKAMGGGRTWSGAGLPSTPTAGEAPPGPPLRIDDARRRVLVPPVEPVPPRSPARPTNPGPRGGDDAA